MSPCASSENENTDSPESPCSFVRYVSLPSFCLVKPRSDPIQIAPLESSYKERAVSLIRPSRCPKGTKGPPRKDISSLDPPAQRVPWRSSKSERTLPKYPSFSEEEVNRPSVNRFRPAPKTPTQIVPPASS